MIGTRLVRSILDFALPRECAACRIFFEGSAKFCPDCYKELIALELAARCRRCAAPLTLPDAPCAVCQGKGIPPFKQIKCLGLLKDPLQSSIHRVKYENRWSLGEHLTDRLLQRPDVEELLQLTDILVPVPLHRARQRKRGFNQAEVIARRLAKCSANPAISVASVARRIRDTQMQTHLHSRGERERNLRDAFTLIDGESITGKQVVLVDDVFTTGATLRSLTRVLKPAKPAKLSVIVLAIADPRGPGV